MTTILGILVIILLIVSLAIPRWGYEYEQDLNNQNLSSVDFNYQDLSYDVPPDFNCDDYEQGDGLCSDDYNGFYFFSKSCKYG